jgi:hypothetical protein
MQTKSITSGKKHSKGSTAPLAASESVSSKVQALADWLQLDIRRRGLRPGDRYLTSEEAARALGVSTGTAHQAMRILVEQNVLNRRQKQGTFVGLAVDPPVVQKRPRVYVLSPADATRDPSYARVSEVIYPAISSALGGAALQLEYLPSGDSLGFVRSLVEEAELAGNLGGFVLMRSTFEMQEFFEEQRYRIPAVVMGSVYPGITALPKVDADHHSAGQQVANYALRGGHRRMIVMMHDHWVPGDSHLVSGIAQSLELSSARLDRFEICSVPPYERAIRHRLVELLSAADRPSMLVVRMSLQVAVLLDVVKELGLRIPEDLDVVFGNLQQQLPTGVSLPHFALEPNSMYEVGAQIGGMLAALRNNQPLEIREVIHPLRFVECS